MFETVVHPFALPALRWQASHGGFAILAYHNVAPDGAAPAGDLPLHLPLSRFLAQIDRLRRTHRIVPLAELTERPTDTGGRPRAAITFDDAYRGALTLALPALAQRRVPATVFVPPGLIGAPSFWWDDLSSPRDGLDPLVRERALGRERGRPAAAATELRSDQAPGSLDELERAADLPGVTLAPHGWTHANLTALSDGDLAEELERPRAWLRAWFPRRALADHLAFPYGLWDERVVRAARQARYRFLYRVNGGPGTARPLAGQPLPRINVPAAVSVPGLDLRTAGIVG